jgi:hypothetical protein
MRWIGNREGGKEDGSIGRIDELKDNEGQV